MAVTEPSLLKVEALRRQFPIFKRSFNGKELAYLDNAATTQKPGIVIQELTRFYSESNANIHRGAYALSEEATAAYEGARQHVAGLIHARSVQEVVFVRNATEAINLVAYAWGRRNIHPGDRIVLTELEHHSNLVPWQLLAQEREALLEFVPIDGQGRLDLAVLDRLLQQEPKLVAVGHVSNALGTINPVTEIVRKAHAAGARVLVDGAQSVPHQPVDVTEIDADFLAFSGHKMCGPTGIGVLYGKQDVLEAMPPFLGGGDMIRQVQLHESTWNDLPWKFEAGTPHIAGAVGLGAAVKFLQGIGMQAIFVHEQQLLATLLDRLQSLPYVSLYGPSDPAEQAGIVSFTLGHIHAHDVATVLDRHAVAVRSGHHCCQPLMERLHVPATVRASLYLYSTEHEVERLVQGIQDAARIFRLDRAVRGDARG